MGQQQTAHKTQVTPQQVLEAVAGAIVDYFHWTPTAECLLVLLAQSAFETGWWASMWNNNLGNFKAIAGGEQDWCYYRCNELLQSSQIPDAWRSDPRVQIIDRGSYQEVWFSPDHPACCFMSFSTLKDAATKHLKKIVETYSKPNDESDGDAWHWATLGDVQKYCEALKLHSYFTDGIAHYVTSVMGCYQRLQSMSLDFNHLPSWTGDPPAMVIDTTIQPDPEEIP